MREEEEERLEIVLDTMIRGARKVVESWGELRPVWISNRVWTVLVEVGPDGTVRIAPPIVRWSLGKPVQRLVETSRRKGGHREVW